MNQSNVNKLYFWPVRSELSLLVFYVPLCAVLCSHLSEVGTSAGAGPDWGSASPLPWWSQPRDSSCCSSPLYTDMSQVWALGETSTPVQRRSLTEQVWGHCDLLPGDRLYRPPARPALETRPLHSTHCLLCFSGAVRPALLPSCLLPSTIQHLPRGRPET